MPNLEKIIKSKKISQKGASGSGKPKKSYVSLQEKVLIKNTQFEELEPSVASEKPAAEIHKAPAH